MKFFFLLMITTVLVVVLVGCASSNYNEAMELYEEGSYEEAKVLFEELDDYEDSSEMVAACRYDIAMLAYEDESFEEAQVLFEELDDYEDSSEMVAACRYDIAMLAYEDESFEEAQVLFEELDDYEDSSEMVIVCKERIASDVLIEIYEKKCDSKWAEIADDGSYLSIDSNPHDIDDAWESDAYYALERINEELGFPASVFRKMGETTSLDGRLTEKTDTYIVSWKYHPDKGAEVLYEVSIEE